MPKLHQIMMQGLKHDISKGSNGDFANAKGCSTLLMSLGSGALQHARNTCAEIC